VIVNKNSPKISEKIPHPAKVGKRTDVGTFPQLF